MSHSRPEKHAKPETRLIHLANLVRERHRALLVQAVGHGERFGMIGDRDVFVAALARGLGHLFERRPAVGFGGVHVQIAADLRLLDQLRQLARSAAASISPEFSRSSGGIQARPSAS